MGFLDKLFGKRKKEEAESPEQAVIVHFDYMSTDLTALFELEAELERVISSAGVGEYDGNDVAVDGRDGHLYMYGPEADVLFSTIRPALEAAPFMKDARVKLRYGLPEEGVREIEVVLGK